MGQLTIKMLTSMYSLNWNQFEKSTSQTFKELLGQLDFADVTLVSDDLEQIQAHKVILSSCSSKLKYILKQSPKKEPIIYMTGVSYNEMTAMINFMYLGETEIEHDDLAHFLEIAENFDIQGLCQLKDYDSKGKHEEVSAIKETYHEIETEKDIINYESTDDFSSALEPAVQTSVAIQQPTENYCDKCDYKTEHTGHMKRHKSSVHNGEKFVCGECASQFSFPHGLERHRKSKHL